MQTYQAEYPAFLYNNNKKNQSTVDERIKKRLRNHLRGLDKEKGWFFET